MLRFLSLLLLSAAVGSSACTKDDRRGGDRLSFSSLEFGIPAGLNPVAAHGINLENVPTEHARFEREFGVAWSDWDRVEPGRATLSISESGLTWDFAEEVVLRISTDELDWTEVFYRDQIPRDVGGNLNLIPTEFDASQLLDGERVNVQLELRRLRGAPPQSLPVVLSWNFTGFR